MTECYYMPRVGELFFPEDPPEEKEEVSGWGWTDPEFADKLGVPPGKSEYRHTTHFPQEDFEILAHTFTYLKDVDVSFDYLVVQHKETGTLYARRTRTSGSRPEGREERETIFRVDDWQSILQMACNDAGGYFEKGLDWVLSDYDPELDPLNDLRKECNVPGSNFTIAPTVVIGRDELRDNLVETLQEDRLKLPDDAPEELYEALLQELDDYEARHEAGEDG